MQVVSAILFLVFLWMLGLYIFGLIRPKHKTFASFGKNVTRKTLSAGYIPILLGLLILIGIVTPSHTQADNTAQQNASQAAEKQKALEAANLKTLQSSTPQTKDVIETVSIPFDSQTQNDAALPQGQTKIMQAGVNGSKQVTYSVTIVNGKEIGRSEKLEVVTTQPTPQITAVGTYVTPTAPQQTATSGSGYTNVDGNHVNSPSSNPAGATAQCNDGTYSDSQHRSGTCSHHGGVAAWL